MGVDGAEEIEATHDGRVAEPLLKNTALVDEDAGRAPTVDKKATDKECDGDRRSENCDRHD